MPIEYPSGTIAEHTAVRDAVGMFDVSHMGKIAASGPGTLGALQRAFTNDASKLSVGGAQYTMALNDAGGIVDDLIVSRLGDERFLIVPNAANVGLVYEAFTAQAGDDVDSGVLHDWTLIAVQGPGSPDVVGELFPDTTPLAYMHCTDSTWRDGPAIVSRTGYTGERGYEVFAPDVVVVDLWRALLDTGTPFGLLPAGLGARDTLRTEMGYPLHGNDISVDRTPLEAGLSWAVSFGKGDFVGRDALLRQREEGVPRRLWGLRMEDRLIPRSHYGVFRGDDLVGETTSGTFSPTLRRGIGLAYLWPFDGFEAGADVEVDIRGKRGRATVVKPPFVDASPK
jgi:aminomethyltransferase